MHVRIARLSGVVLAAMISFSCPSANADPVLVRFPQGFTHGYLALRTLDGKLVATGEEVQSVHGYRVTSRLIFHFVMDRWTMI